MERFPKQEAFWKRQRPLFLRTVFIRIHGLCQLFFQSPMALNLVFNVGTVHTASLHGRSSRNCRVRRGRWGFFQSIAAGPFLFLSYVCRLSHPASPQPKSWGRAGQFWWPQTRCVPTAASDPGAYGCDKWCGKGSLCHADVAIWPDVVEGPEWGSGLSSTPKGRTWKHGVSSR